MKINKKFLFTVVICTLVAGLSGYYLGDAKNNSVVRVPTKTEKVSDISAPDRSSFPPLDMPIDYFDAKELSRGLGFDYNVIIDADSYRSYPSTTISFNNYSDTQSSLPPVKTDKEIFTSDGDFDFTETRKKENIRQYGDLARRFISKDTSIYDVKKVDLDKDGKAESVLSLSLSGANEGAAWVVVVKDNKVVFSTDENIFATLIPAKNGNGFFVEWSIDKEYDGYTTTRFTFDGNKFVPVYEQVTRYVRILEKRGNKL